MEMEEEPMRSPHVEATGDDLEGASRKMAVEPETCHKGNVSQGLEEMEQEPRLEPSDEATCDDPEEAAAVGTMPQEPGTVEAVCNSEEAAAEAVVHVGLEIEQEPRPKPTVEATCNGSEVVATEATDASLDTMPQKQEENEAIAEPVAI
ncbi:hypothetical protein KFL_003670080 [Klebsormidium nitens]|uniref:Uncharacterized protein n=1 Tax=Klebsormidium nitens TaxID=105231 RepID=A0A1Y1IFY4_KLENI|nr:hypothetical protein KFL_003670080 [Klebsormidium nitens]|eukprot:GAQ87647.1 hypothetical protein KFL_003670080 [Klebsormidium nitens]